MKLNDENEDNFDEDSWKEETETEQDSEIEYDDEEPESWKDDY